MYTFGVFCVFASTSKWAGEGRPSSNSKAAELPGTLGPLPVPLLFVGPRLGRALRMPCMKSSILSFAVISVPGVLLEAAAALAGGAGAPGSYSANEGVGGGLDLPSNSTSGRGMVWRVGAGGICGDNCAGLMSS